MALSRERQEYHLTPCGWVEGSFKGDALGGSNEVDIPSDRVLTVCCYDELPAFGADPYFYDEIVWKCEDENLIEQLQAEYGKRPDWFGYKMMK